MTIDPRLKDAIERARADAEAGRRCSVAPSPWNDWDDSQAYESFYNEVYDKIAAEVRKEKKERQAQREAQWEREQERLRRMTPEEREEEKRYGAIGCIIGIIVVYFLFKAFNKLLLSL